MAIELSKLGEGFTEPAAKVANNLIDKVSNAVGWLAKPHGVREAKIDAKKSIIKDISERKDINPITRFAIVNNIGRIEKEYLNQVKILDLAIQFLEPSAKPEDMNDDWISFFFDKVRLVSDDKMRLIWAKLLANEANEPNSYSKNIIHILTIMSNDDADSFIQLLPFCLWSKAHNTQENGVILFVYSDGAETYKNSFYTENGLSYNGVLNCEKLGLIKLYETNSHVLRIKDLEVHYDQACYLVSSIDENFLTGSIYLTDEGEQLYKISTKTYDDNIIRYYIEKWRALGYTVSRT